MKLKKFLLGLKKSQEVLEALDNSGIDIDRLIGISNAQGPQAKIIKSVLTQVSGLIDVDTSVGSPIPKAKQLRSHSSSKRKNNSSP